MQVPAPAGLAVAGVVHCARVLVLTAEPILCADPHVPPGRWRGCRDQVRTGWEREVWCGHNRYDERRAGGAEVSTISGWSRELELGVNGASEEEDFGGRSK